MKKINVDTLAWEAILSHLDEKGHALICGLIPKSLCEDLIGNYEEASYFRKTIQMARYQFGQGEYKYFSYPLPDWIAELREKLYTQLVDLANAWMYRLGLAVHYPPKLSTWLAQCHESGQNKCTALLLKYGPGDYNCLHQDLYGANYFPIQAAIFLNQAGSDYQGGEFVMTEQRPRAQSRVSVIQPDRGDLLLFTTQFRPKAGTRGHYRLPMKHGVSEIREGQRHTLGIIFHDAQT